MELPKSYKHTEYEKDIYKKWEESGNFTPKIDPDKRPFTISMPPPNVTGKLHVGHALTTTLQDIMTRYHRMIGDSALWLPGTDHAGIATQNVVEKQLKKEGKTRHDLGREKFVDRVWEWKEEYGSTIVEQTKQIGASCDWTRERFTLDEGLSQAVTEAFKQLYDKGLVYRGLRTVNWCPRCHSAIADDEVEYKKEKGKFYWLKYGPFTLATARPETKLGDTAVAVNPKDKRYRDMVGKTYKIPGVLGEFEVKVVADNAVDPEFGTGAVKVTPAHSLIDYEIAKRHDIPLKQVIDEDGKMMANTGKYAGMTTRQARKAIVEDMQKMDLIDHIDEDYEHNIAVCYRCDTQIEPIPSMQWFVKMEPLAKAAKKAVKDGDIKILPKRFEKVYYHWLDNIRDWCISRQLWWGHRIPVWYKQNPKSKVKSQKSKISDIDIPPEDIHVGSEPPKDGEWVQDEDVLDTWFSSGLWPFSTLGWPLNKNSIGFNEKLVDMVIGGEKTKTYRLSDKKLFPNAWVEVKNTQSGKSFGYIKIESVEKTTVNDLEFNQDGHEKYKDKEDFVKTMRSYYPEKKVTDKTPVWIYKFVYQSKPDLNYFFPTTVMETGYDILFFWVARMIMMSLELTGKKPFETVYLHGLVRDEQNRKMSKSLGNSIDPLEVIEKYGADALRMSLVVGSTPGNDMALGESKIKGYRNFSNKVWNIARFVFMNLDRNEIQLDLTKDYKLSDQDKKDLKELDKIVKKTSSYIEKFKFSKAGELLYDYTWHTFADKIIEEAKPRIQSEDKEDGEAAAYKVFVILKTCLKLLHPFMPFVTESIWSHIDKDLKEDELLIGSNWPTK